MTKISNYPHKDVLCLISLTTDLRKKMTNKGCDPDDAIKKLKGIGVDVCDLSIQSLSKIEQYKVVIIICHHIKSQDNDALVLSDNTFLPVDVFVHTISTEFTGLLDLAICDSKAMAYEIKALSKYPDALKIQFAEEETDIEFRLCYIYPDLLKNFSFDPIDDYKQRYREAYLEAIEEAEREQKEKVKDINLLPAGTKLGDSSKSSSDSINTSVFMPKEVTRGEFFKLQIKMHLDIDTGTLYLEDAEGNDPNTVQRKKNVAIKNIQIGDELLLNLCFLDGGSYPIPIEQIKVKKELNKEELNSIDNIYTLGITISEENQMLVLHVKIANEYIYSKFFTIIEFVKDGKPLIEPFNLQTGFKTDDSQKYSNIKRSRVNIGGNQNKLVREPKRIHLSIEQMKQQKASVKPRETMTFGKKSGVTEGHLWLLYRKLTKEGWIEGNEADFKVLFSSKRDEDCKLTWMGLYGKGTLVELFKQFVNEGLITVAVGFTIPSILEGHFMDVSGVWLTGLDKGNSANYKALPFIQECLKLLKADPEKLIDRSYQDDEEFSTKYDSYDHQDMHLRKR